MASRVQALRRHPHHEWPSTFHGALAVGRARTIEFEEGSHPETFVKQALSKLPDSIYLCGETTGFVVNYTPDEVILYDKQGRQVKKLAEVVPDSWHRRQPKINIGDRAYSSRTLSKLLGEVG